MPNKYAEVTPRNFNPMWAPGLSDEARKAVNAAFDAMSTWRIETAKVLARHQPDRQLAERKRVGDEPHAVLDAMGGAVAESLGRRDAPPLILESRAAACS